MVTLTVVQQEHDAQKVRQEEHDVDHKPEQRKDPIIQEQAMTSRRSRSEATGAARSEQLGRAQVLSKRPRDGDIREQRPNARGAGRAGCRLARARVRAEGLYQQDQAPPDMLTGQSTRACLRAH